jgi:hypothetical protein
MMSGVNTTFRRVILWILNALGAFVGAWALLAPQAFYDVFPGIGFGAWVGADGPFNEHLIRDVGALYLALVAAGVVAALMRRADASIAVGVAWLVFSVPHFGYHLLHLGDLPPLDAIAEPVSLAIPLALSIPLVIPPRDRAIRGTMEPTREGTR